MSRWQPYPAYKASGVEWLGEIPAHWEALPLKFAARQDPNAIKTGPFGSQLLSSEMEAGKIKVYNQRNVIDADLHQGENYVTEEKYRELYSFTVYPGDMLVTTRGTIGRCVIVPDDAELGILHPCLMRIQPDPTKLLAEFLILLVQDSFLVQTQLFEMSNATTIEVIYSGTMRQVVIPLPPLPEQRAIAAFLDAHTARLDAAVAEQRRLIDLLGEKRAALISHAVTRGLDPIVPMKESGVEWLGEIPSHWEISQLRRLVAKFVDYRGATPEKVVDGIPLITARNIKNGVIDFDLSQEFIREEDYDSWMVRGLPEVGDVLITTEAPLGATAQIIDTKIALAQRIILLKANKEKITNDYLKYYFASLSGQGELWSRATGSTAIGIKASWLREILVTVPPLEEQRAISAHLDRETARLDAAVAEIEQSIAHLEEYRTALVAAAVTGQIDVRQT